MRNVSTAPAGRSGPRPLPALSALVLAAAVSPIRLGAQGEPGAPLIPDETAVLRAVCDYLRLSQSQARRLAMFAEEVSRTPAARQLQAEVQELRRLEALPNPDEAGKELLADFRSSVRNQASLADRMSAFGNSALVRNLTREQIALVWRLTRGSPPAYAEADPSLLQPAAGFATGSPDSRLRVRFLRASGEPGSLERVLIEPSGSFVITDLEVSTRQTQGQSGSPPAGGVRLRSALQSASDLIVFSEEREDGKPFPQRVIESNNLDEFLPVGAPFARRVFLSPEWRHVLARYARTGPFPRPRTATRVDSLPMVRLYRMERGLRDGAGRGPELLPLGGAIETGQYRFGPGQGLELPDAGVSDHYAFQFDFRHQAGEGYKKLLDFRDRAKDDGLYLYNGKLTFYTLAVGGPLTPGREQRLRLERNAATRIVRLYLNYRPVFAFIDLDGEAVFHSKKAVLFADDRTTKGEEGSGSVSSVTVWGPAARPRG